MLKIKLSFAFTLFALLDCSTSNTSSIQCSPPPCTSHSKFDFKTCTCVYDADGGPPQLPGPVSDASTASDSGEDAEYDAGLD